ncbi:LCP family protein [Microbacterium sp. CJ88]|uniref:LCP family protein n=1 Tax=Microbacterium sp. CJ88 TaxID=3445672 RepID=UPI003F65AC47
MSPTRRTRVPLARHGRLHTPNPVLQLLGTLGVAVLVAVVAISGVGAFALWNTTDAIAANSVTIGSDATLPPPTMGEIEGDVTMLIVGTDSCAGPNAALSGACQAGDTAGERNDVTMLVRISANPRRVTVISIPRDMLVDIPTCTGPDGTTYGSQRAAMLNVSYSHGGLACSVATVEKLTGTTIQYAAAIRWTGVINLSDAIGGVDVCVAGNIDDTHTGLHLTAGQHTLQGVEALQFLRIRHGIGDGSDLGRISNQQQFMSSLVRKLQNQSVLTNPTTLFGIATTAMQQVTSGQLVLSSGLANPTRMVQIAMALKSVPFADIVFVQYPTQYASGVGASRVLPVTSAADALFQALAANKALQLTGDASQGYGVAVTGSATPSPTPTPTDAATATPTEAPTTAPTTAPGATPAPSATASDTVALPSQIAGSTAAQVTCTQPQK